MLKHTRPFPLPLFFEKLQSGIHVLPLPSFHRLFFYMLPVFMACGGGGNTSYSEQQMSRLFREIQTYEAQLEAHHIALFRRSTDCSQACRDAIDICQISRRICEIARKSSDRDALSRCRVAVDICRAGRESVEGRCMCEDTPQPKFSKSGGEKSFPSNMKVE